MVRYIFKHVCTKTKHRLIHCSCLPGGGGGVGVGVCVWRGGGGRGVIASDWGKGIAPN